jgi:AcrR family transcriptional regulator
MPWREHGNVQSRHRTPAQPIDENANVDWFDNPRGCRKYLLQMQATTDSRRRLLDAAAHEFALFGPQGARIQAIVARAGINERMIYHHFGSKDELYRAVLEDQWLSLASGWGPILARAKALEPLAGLRLAFTGLLRLMLEHPLLPGLAFHESLTGWQAAPPAGLASIPPELKRLFKQGQRSGQLRRDCEFTVLYLSLISALTSFTIIGRRFTELRERFASDPHAVERLGGQIVELVLSGAVVAHEQRAGPNQRSRAARSPRPASGFSSSPGLTAQAT